VSTQSSAVPTRTWRQTLRAGGAWVLVAGCLLLLGAMLIAGERTTSYDDLRAAVASGEVDEVRISGGLPESGDGFALTEVHWRSGVVDRVTVVVETSSRSEVRESGLEAPVVVGHVDDRLTRLHPGLRVTRGGELTGYSEVASWRVPSWCGGVAVVVAIAAFVLLVIGPQPWRATRWAWFWLLFVAPPLGLLTFLLLGGSTRCWPPTRPSRRLTGGKAFLLLLVVAPALDVLADTIL
jgi:hypothetical protein